MSGKSSLLGKALFVIGLTVYIFPMAATGVNGGGGHVPLM